MLSPVAFTPASIAAAKKRKKKPAPRLPAEPPPGTYDPALSAQGRSAQRSYDDLLQNLAIGKQRSQDDLKLALANVATGTQRLGEDRTTALANLDRNYTALAHRQSEHALQGNVQSAGLLAQSLQSRMAARTQAQQPIDTSYSRALEDAKRRSDALKLGFERLYGKSGTNVVNVARAGRDLTAGKLDIAGEKWWQAAQLGYAPAAPARIPKRKTRRQVVV
jgi:hypothetical protein